MAGRPELSVDSTMTIRAGGWYRVKETRQYCRIQRIPSTTNPQISVPKADENTRGFELALEWYSPAGAQGERSRGEPALEQWTKRVMILDVKKGCALFRDPGEDDLPRIEAIKRIAHTLPIASASRDGELTLPSP